ncbi:uncharacterized protein LOC123552572 [Mercenaria mercenaria]|uniref:uncharacterized protein LOC123552572 n=1 Tax=Mercenaria mercenaria TaxID=6596 RepID=UPI00234FADF7|nr:uncharacterized protein LOC123552572 [Mercenaria mercenaria]
MPLSTTPLDLLRAGMGLSQVKRPWYFYTACWSVNAQIELNPGPSTSKSQYLCGHCEEEVTWTQKGILCDTCEQWYHTDCQGIGDSTYDRLSDSRSIKNKIPDLHQLIQQVKPDIISCTETWLKPDIQTSEIFPKDLNFQVFRDDRTSGQGGGVLTAISKHLISQEEPELKTNCNLSWAKITIKGAKDIYIGTYYKPHENDEDSLTELWSSLSKVPQDSTIWLLGDFNLPDIDWSSEVPKSKCRFKEMYEDFIDRINSFNLQQMVKIPTRNENILDLFLTNFPSLVQCTKTIPCLGLSFRKCISRTRYFQGQVVTYLTNSSRRVCGRPPDAVINIEDGTVMCAKNRGIYSANGEVLTFYLSRLLRTNNVPIVIHVRTNATSNFWRHVNYSTLSWEENQLVSLIEWINDSSLSKTRLPPLIYNAFMKGEPITANIINTSKLLDRTPAGIAEIVQWGNMILLDFLTAHSDRHVNLHIADEKSKHPRITSNFTRNLIHTQEGKLWLIDNERTLYQSFFGIKCANNTCLPRRKVLERLLKTICVFQKPVVEALMHHLRKGSVFKTLLSLSASYQFLENNLEIDDEYSLIEDILDNRAAKVVYWIQNCQKRI